MMWGTTDRAVSQMTRGIADRIMCRVTYGVAYQGTRPTTQVRTCLAPDLSTVYSLLSTAPEMTSETAPQTMSDIASPTKDETTVRTTP
jgi:hypothetical protein